MSQDELRSESGDVVEIIPVNPAFSMSDPGEIRPLLHQNNLTSTIKTHTPPNTPLSGGRSSYLTIRQLEQCTILVEPENDDLSDSSEPPVHDLTPVDHGGTLRYPNERLKTLVAFLFMAVCMFCSTTALAIVHDRVPNTPPLPDVVFDLIPQWDLGLQISEYLIIVSLWTTLILLFFHRYRWIVFRRLFFIVGLLYLGRAVTMLVTAVPVANTDYYCSPKMNHTSPLIILERIAKLLSGLGLSVNGQHVYCGDYIYSGHTCVLLLSALMMDEYAPKKYFLLRILVFLMAATGIVMVSVSRGHYTVDIIVAYYITTRVFWMYHAMVCNAEMKNFGPNNYLSRIGWFRLMRYLEVNVAVGKLPKHYTWPLPFPKRWQDFRLEYDR
ncbi:hypothetical protein RvY_08375 [Ramazzottius varieornatus]|uniref:Sphingomyelin synthase-like domain-containing protein n=1 Tax=Ramazzottius varieornatus TaxID=947166 RepID=A0A1D1V5P3_RAMVA|nr:hypothetical protein RvY_08375 [Ramazzottius varieornatus]